MRAPGGPTRGHSKLQPMFGYTFLKRPVLRARAVQEIEALKCITQPDVHLAYLDRIQTAAERQFFAALLPSFRGFQSTVAASEAPALIASHVATHVPASALAHAWAQELARATHTFAAITHAQRLQIILKRVEDDACRKFHTDRYDLRMFCTYVGKGTEWLEEQHVNRSALVAGTNDQIVKDWSKVRHIEAGQLAIFQGEASAQNRNKGIVHRSPPIEREGGMRIIFRVDPV